MKIEIPNVDRVGILLSGGMDSSLLLYLLSINTKKTIQPFTIPKHDGAKNYVQPVIDWISKETTTDIKNPIIIGDPDIHHSLIVGDALNRIFRHNLIDHLFMGCNDYPQKILPGGPIRKFLNNDRITSPFYSFWKTDILELYVKHNLWELLNLTHTCTEQSVGRCNLCWQCRERKWAFDELQLVDLSTR